MRAFLLSLQLILMLVALRTPGVLGGILNVASLWFLWAGFRCRNSPA
jgi:hypothetical protein